MKQKDYHFEQFTRARTRASNYAISFNGKGTFGILSGLYTKENIKNFKKVVLFFDKTKRSIAFKFVNENVQGAFAIIHTNNTGVISARSFATNYDLNKPQYTGRRKPTKIIDPIFGELFVLDLIKKEESAPSAGAPLARLSL